MRKFGLAGIIFIFLLIAAFAAEAAVDQATKDYRLRIGKKAERGVGNILFGWTEIPKRIVDITKETKNPIKGLLLGTFHGTGDAFARTTSGVCDVATCTVRNDQAEFIKTEMDTERTTAAAADAKTK